MCVLQDIEIDRSLPGNKQYVNISLWQEISRSTNRVYARTDQALEKLDTVSSRLEKDYLNIYLFMFFSLSS